MGLDNGFVVRGIPKNKIPCYVRLPFDDEDEDGSITIAYWRKCWGIREAILKVLHPKKDEYTINVDAEDLPAIIRSLMKFCSKEYWEENGDSIWEFEEIFEFSLLQQIINLKWLYFYMNEATEEVTCYFYDSF